MSAFLGIIKNGNIDVGSSFNEKRYSEWLKENDGRPVRITTNDEKSDEQRGYYFGAIVPAIATHHNSNDLELWHEVLKQEFNGVVVKRKNGQLTKVGMSTRKLNKHNFAEYLNKITGWMSDQGIAVPDSEDYKNWRDGAPALGEEFEK